MSLYNPDGTVNVVEWNATRLNSTRSHVYEYDGSLLCYHIDATEFEYSYPMRWLLYEVTNVNLRAVVAVPSKLDMDVYLTEWNDGVPPHFRYTATLMFLPEKARPNVP